MSHVDRIGNDGIQAKVARTNEAGRNEGNRNMAKKSTTKPAATVKNTKAKVAKAAKAKTKMSALDAAAKVLAEAGEPMTTGAMIEQMAAKKYWVSPGGKTPAATLYAAILREINTKGKEARFTKTDRGLFSAAK